MWRKGQQRFLVIQRRNASAMIFSLEQHFVMIFHDIHNMRMKTIQSVQMSFGYKHDL